ncbi:MAG TPA: FAD-dependent monooxygenase, partial [Vicinamibacterales bacterium]
MSQRRTQVGIVGAGPAGLMLGQLLAAQGIDSVILEARDEPYVIERVRAGVLEQGSVDLLRATGVGGRLDREGMRHGGVYLAFNGERHHVNMEALTNGRAITVYGQNEVVRDLIDARRASGRPLHFNATATAITGLVDSQPTVHFVENGEAHELVCDFVAGCDGFHGVSRQSIPANEQTAYERVYPFAWLGILAD